MQRDARISLGDRHDLRPSLGTTAAPATRDSSPALSRPWSMSRGLSLCAALKVHGGEIRALSSQRVVAAPPSTTSPHGATAGR